MTRTRARLVIFLSSVSCLLLPTLPVSGQSGSGTVEWRSYGNDLRQTRYSPLDQINASNFNQLEVAWRFKTDNLGPRPEFNLQTTPLMVKGVLYATGGTRRSVIALNPGTGEEPVSGVMRRPAHACVAAPVLLAGLPRET
jgi:quinoprotein glucose dehydrogenase